jgi:hypothetical protein
VSIYPRLIPKRSLKPNADTALARAKTSPPRVVVQLQSVDEFSDGAGLLARIGADHLGHAKVSMTQDRYMSRGRAHNRAADLLDRAVTDINDE